MIPAGTPRFPSFAVRTTALAGLLLATLPVRADLLGNLQAFPDRIAVGDPGVDAEDGTEGPKGIATADADRDGKSDLAVSNFDGTKIFPADAPAGPAHCDGIFLEAPG